ncbi:MAG TPA: hypothetical protein VFH47_06015 [Candidatus Thermoplasmatota archaeon]|nr:hypothetical protein [Candidatus Thermoplasmatota archaeon]
MTTRTKTAGVAAAAIAALALLATPALAHENNNHGTIKVHDDASADPATRNQPHVSCDFWIEGFNMSTATGTLVFTDWPPTGNKTEVLEVPFAGTPEADGDGFHFNVGPITLDAGHYRVEAFLDEGHPGGRDHSAKSKMFWVHPCGDFESFPCPPAIQATMLEGGDVRLDFTAAEGSDGTNVYRAAGEGELTLLGQFDADATVAYDNTTKLAGVEYTYVARAVYGDVESQGCPSDQVVGSPEIEVPFFTNPASIALAVLGTLGAFGILARRKASCLFTVFQATSSPSRRTRRGPGTGSRTAPADSSRPGGPRGQPLYPRPPERDAWMTA